MSTYDISSAKIYREIHSKIFDAKYAEPLTFDNSQVTSNYRDVCIVGVGCMKVQHDLSVRRINFSANNTAESWALRDSISLEAGRPMRAFILLVQYLAHTACRLSRKLNRGPAAARGGGNLDSPI